MGKLYVNLIRNKVRTLDEILENPNISDEVKEQVVAILEG